MLELEIVVKQDAASRDRVGCMLRNNACGVSRIKVFGRKTLQGRQ